MSATAMLEPSIDDCPRLGPASLLTRAPASSLTSYCAACFCLPASRDPGIRISRTLPRNGVIMVHTPGSLGQPVLDPLSLSGVWYSRPIIFSGFHEWLPVRLHCGKLNG